VAELAENRQLLVSPDIDGILGTDWLSDYAGLSLRMNPPYFQACEPAI
jgi:hypothetical protein